MDIRSYVAPLLKWWWLIVLATLLAAGGSYYALLDQPDVYQSRATLLVGRTIDDPNPTGNQFTLGEQLAQYYANLAQREPVRRAVMQDLGLSRLPEYYVTALPKTAMLEVIVSDTSPERAQAVANAFAQQLIELTPATVAPEEQERQQFVEKQLDDLQQQIEDTAAELNDKQAELGEAFSAQEINIIQGEIGALQTKLNTLQSNFASLLESSQESASNTLTVLEQASLPHFPVKSQIELTIVVAAAVGFVLASGSTYLLDYLDDSVKSPRDVQQYTRLPTLTSVARIKKSENESSLIAHERPRSPHAEAFRMLRTNLNSSNQSNAPQKLLVTSPMLGDGKSVTASNLAIVAAQSGDRVLLVDLDLHRPTIHTIFGLGNRQGISSLWLQGTDIPAPNQLGRDIVNVIKPTPVANLFVLTCGPIIKDTSAFLNSEKLQAILHFVLTKFDFVVLDSPPCLVVTDPLILSSKVDEVLLVVRAGKTSRDELKRAIERLQRVDAQVAGVVLNRKSDMDASYYYSEKYYRRELDANVKASKQKRRNLVNRLLRKHERGRADMLPSE